MVVHPEALAADVKGNCGKPEPASCYFDPTKPFSDCLRTQYRLESSMLAPRLRDKLPDPKVIEPHAPSVAGNYHHHFTNGFVYITVDECHRINIVCSSHFKPCEQVLYETAYKGYGNYLARECATAQQTGLPEQEGLVLQANGCWSKSLLPTASSRPGPSWPVSPLDELASAASIQKPHPIPYDAPFFTSGEAKQQPPSTSTYPNKAGAPDAIMTDNDYISAGGNGEKDRYSRADKGSGGSETEKSLAPQSVCQAELVRADEAPRFRDFYRRKFEHMQQALCKMVVKEWIKTVQAKKQGTHMYNGGKKARDEGIDEDKNKRGTVTVPPWWPDTKEVSHKEPDHLKKEERIRLMLHLLLDFANPEVGTDAAYTRASAPAIDSRHTLSSTSERDRRTLAKPTTVARLRAATDKIEPAVHREIDDAKRFLRHLKDIYEARTFQERYLRGENDGSATIALSFPPREPPGRKKREPRQPEHANRLTRGSSKKAAPSPVEDASEEDNADADSASERRPVKIARLSPKKLPRQAASPPARVKVENTTQDQAAAREKSKHEQSQRRPSTECPVFSPSGIDSTQNSFTSIPSAPTRPTSPALASLDFASHPTLSPTAYTENFGRLALQGAAPASLDDPRMGAYGGPLPMAFVPERSATLPSLPHNRASAMSSYFPFAPLGGDFSPNGTAGGGGGGEGSYGLASEDQTSPLQGPGSLYAHYNL